MNIKITIAKTQACHCCEGRKKVASTEWIEFYKTFGSTALVKMSDDDIDSWFRANYGIKTPSEEDWCPNCEGLGAITEELSFASIEEMQAVLGEQGGAA